MYKRILVPLDGSRLAEAPLPYAGWLAGKSGAELVLIHVYSSRIPRVSHYLGDQIEWIMHRNNIRGSAGVNVQPVVAHGDPASEILKYAEESQVDLITMSTHGRTGVSRWLIGSVADKVVHHSECPVRPVKSFSNFPPGTSDSETSVLALLDGSEMADQVLPYAAYHAGIGSGELVLLSVCEPPDIVPAVTYHLIPPQGYPPTNQLHWQKYVNQETEKRQRECNLYLEKVAEVNEGKGLKIRFHAPLGKPVEEITRFLENNAVGLVAMTTRGRSGLSRWVFGSVAEKVLLASPNPVLIVKPR